MAYNTEELKQKALEQIAGKKLIWIEEVATFIGIATSTFYEHFPSESSDYKELARALEDNKIELKTGMRKKWYDSEATGLQIGLMKLLGSSEERKRLSQSYVEMDSKIDAKVEHDLPEGLKDVLEKEFEKAIKEYQPDEGIEESSED